MIGPIPYIGGKNRLAAKIITQTCGIRLTENHKLIPEHSGF